MCGERHTEGTNVGGFSCDDARRNAVHFAHSTPTHLSHMRRVSVSLDCDRADRIVARPYVGLLLARRNERGPSRGVNREFVVSTPRGKER